MIHIVKKFRDFFGIKPLLLRYSTHLGTTKLWVHDYEGFQLHDLAWNWDGSLLATVGYSQAALEGGPYVWKIPGLKMLTDISTSLDERKVQVVHLDSDASWSQIREDFSKMSTMCWSPTQDELVIGNTSVWIYSIRQHSLRQFLPPDRQGYRAIWSPDGTQMAVQKGSWTSEQKRNQIQIFQAANAVLVKVLTPVNGAMHSWAPDGTRLAFLAPDDPSTRVVLKNIATDEQQTILPVANSENVQPNLHQIAWSPDGCLLAMATSQQQAQVWRIDGSNVQHVTSLKTTLPLCTGVSFSGDGHLLAAVSMAEDHEYLYRRVATDVQIWRCATWEMSRSFPLVGQTVAKYPESKPVLAFHPRENILATCGLGSWNAQLWQIRL